MRVCGKDIQLEGHLIRSARLAGDGYEFLEDPEPTLTALRMSRVRVDLFTFMQRLPHTSPRYSYPMEWDNAAAVAVSTYDAWWRQIKDTARNKVRLARKRGVAVRVVPFGDDLVRGIAAIYNETRTRQGRRFPHFGKDVDTVGRENGTYLERSVFFGAFLGETIIGFAKLVSDETGSQAGLMQILSMLRHRDKAPTNALIAGVVQSCAERRIPYLVYSQFAYGQKQRDSLSDFKEQNGFRKIDLPRYYVPLTMIGRVALRLRVHHGLRLGDRVPALLAEKLRTLRGRWNNRRPQIVDGRL